MCSMTRLEYIRTRHAGTRGGAEGPPLRLKAGAQALFLGSHFGGELGAEVLGLEHLADLDGGLRARDGRHALDPRDRLVLRLALPHPEAGDELLGFRERAVDDGGLAAGKDDPRPLRARVQPFAGQHDAGIDELFVEIAHPGEDVVVGHDARFAVLVGVHQNHEPHGLCSPSKDQSNRRRRDRLVPERKAGSAYFFLTPSSSSFATTAWPASAGLTARSMKRILPSGPM